MTLKIEGGTINDTLFDIPKCRFCSADAVGHYKLSKGCFCFPDDKEQDLCAQHVVSATPIDSFELAHKYPNSDWFYSHYSSQVKSQSYARMIIRNKEGKFLILKNIKDGSNRWEFPGGKTDPGENLVTTARRETAEETGVKVTVCRYVAERFIHVDSGDWRGEIWEAVDWKGEPKILEPAKFQEMRWVTSEEFAGLPQIPRMGVDLARMVEERDRAEKILHEVHVEVQPHSNS
jgi:8-oxo-dGTP pyrophosphatase MutT (NUDIX family)